MSDKMKLTLKRREMEVEVEGVDNVLVTYTLREMTGTQRDQYMNKMGQKAKMVDGKMQGLKDYSNFMGDLIALSLYDSQGTLVPLKTIQEWPSSVQTALFKEAQKLSALDDRAEEASKND